MRIQFKQVAMTLVVSSSLLMSGLPALADGAAGTDTVAVQASASAVAYPIGSNLQVTIEGVTNEKVTGGVRIGAVIKVTNTSDQTLRIPDHEVKVKTKDGIVYTLRPSSSNLHGVQPDSEVNLVYSKSIIRQTEVSLSDLSLIDVNYDVYPKQETVMFTAPVADMVWDGNRGVISGADQLKKWGDTFVIPTLESPLQYQTADITKSNSNAGTVYVVKLLVTNPSDQSETLPALELDGKSKSKIFAGKQVETGPVSLDAGESKYVHFAIQADLDTVLDSLNVLIPENYTIADITGAVKSYPFTLGKLNITVPEVSKAAAGNYTYGQPIAFEQFNNVINQDLNVALNELHVADNEDQGSKVAFAKFTLTNKGLSDIPVPDFQAVLSSSTGFDYTGTRQSGTLQAVSPGTSTVVSYAFVLPVSETNDTFTMKLQNVIQGQASGDTSAKLASTIASYQVTAQPEEDKHAISLYPYTVDITNSFLSQIMITAQSGTSYTYKLHLDMDLVRDPKVLVDGNFSKLKFELVDASGSIIGSNSFPFTGNNRLVNGKQILTFSNLTSDQFSSNCVVKVYEELTTPTGVVDRLLTELK